VRRASANLNTPSGAPKRILGALVLMAAAGFHWLAWVRAGSGSLNWGTWFYHGAWWSYIAALSGVLCLAGWDLTAVLRRLVIMLPWSVVWWLAFDLYGLRLRNWYYVMVPPAAGARWLGYWTAFATVIPLTMLTHETLLVAGLFRGAKWRPFRVTQARRRALTMAGMACFVLPLALPRCFYPLTWLFAPALIEPWLVGRGVPCLLAEVSEGRPATLLRLLVTGLVVGGLWELFNHGASGRWIYTVPGLERGKLFEMPVPGFLGFPPFAVGTYSFWTLTATRLGIAPGLSSERMVRPLRKAAASLALTLPFCLAGFALVDRGTVRSHAPVAGDLPGWEPIMSARGRSAEELCAHAGSPHVSPSVRDRWCRLLKMAHHRGMGLPRAMELEALGIATPSELRHQEARQLLRRWPGANPPRPEEIAVWGAAAPGGNSR
jgi:hypothetical protein